MGSELIRNTPELSDFVRDCSAVPVLVTVMSTSGTKAPDGSLTEPESDPVCFCAPATPAKLKMSARTIKLPQMATRVARLEENLVTSSPFERCPKIRLKRSKDSSRSNPDACFAWKTV